MELFSNWEQLCKVIANNLDNVQKTFGNSDTEVQINKLCNAVRSLYVGSETVDIYIFGSRLYGLAAENSDVDLYLDIGKRIITVSFNYYNINNKYVCIYI